MRLSPAAVLEELLRYRQSSAADTKWFETQLHNEKLCPAVNDRLTEILDCFVKYHSISHDIQGLRDQGVDVYLKYASAEDSGDEKVVAIQVKSFSDIQRGGVVRDLKSQFVDARRRYGSGLERYYVMLCTDETLHLSRVRDITGELDSERQIRVISPRYALTFFRMPSTTIAGTVDRLLREEDAVHKAARNEVADLSPIGLAIVLDALIFDRTASELEQSAMHPSQQISQMARTVLGELSTDDALTREYLRLDGPAFTRSSEGWQLNSNDFRALRCTRLDAEIRFEYSGTELFEYMYEAFHRSALGPRVDEWPEGGASQG